MKITLDISKLVEEGKLTREEADKLTALAAHDTGSLGINILIGFGVIAIAAGAVALVPTPLTAVGLGLALFAAGCAIVLNRVQQWILLVQICLVIGALMFGGGVIAYGAGSLASMLIVTGAFALAAIAARSSLLMALAVLAASACLGARTGYDNAVYSLAIFEPTLTVVLFSALALIAYQASERLPADYERLAITAARIVAAEQRQIALLPVTALLAVAVATVVMWTMMVLVGREEGTREGGGFLRNTATRFMGLIVIAMGTQFALTGLRDFFSAHP